MAGGDFTLLREYNREWDTVNHDIDIFMSDPRPYRVPTRHSVVIQDPRDCSLNSNVTYTLARIYTMLPPVSSLFILKFSNCLASLRTCHFMIG